MSKSEDAVAGWPTFAPSSLPDDGRQLCCALRLISHLPG